MKNQEKPFWDRLIDVSGIIVFLLLWEILPRLGVVNAHFIPSLSTVLLAIWKLVITGELFLHITASLQRTFIGLVLAIAVAVPAGFLLAGVFPALAQKMRPLLRILGQINAFTLFPIFILFFGIGEFAKVTIIFWSTMWPVLFTTIAGVQQIDPLYVKSARSVGAGRFTIFSKVILPGAAPVIFTGIRFGGTHAFLMLIAAEEIGAKAGLGWLVLNSSVNSIIPRLFAAAVIIAILGVALNYLLQLLEETIVDWKPSAEGENG
ncbi:MAG TPA: ABC transporter permease [Patescibacteria group bacterium]|nr:ABC transporter permease [Patescibacteria group bacterium]